MVKTAVTSQGLFEEAKKILVGGVNSPVRAFKSVGDHPLFIAKGEGATITTEDHQTFIDYVLSWGPLILGHAHPEVNQAIIEAAHKGTSFGAPTQLETQLAASIQRDYPHMNKVRLVNSGTEASMSAIRLARGFTNKKKILKFNGCYHGHSDSLLVAAGSGGLTHGVPDSAGILPELAEHTLVANYNDAQRVVELFGEYGDDIAAIILEPVCGNMGVILPTTEFLETLQAQCKTHGALLIFDEVMCGYRTDATSASALFGISPDLTILGKIIGGGLPCGAYGGREDVMAHLSPEGPVYQAGTLSGNPIVMAAGLKTLELIRSLDLVSVLSQRCQRFSEDLQDEARQQGLSLSVTRSGSMFSLFFTDKTPTSLDDVKATNIALFPGFHKAMLEKGIYLAPSAYEANFLSLYHTDEILVQTKEAILEVLSNR